MGGGTEARCTDESGEKAMGERSTLPAESFGFRLVRLCPAFMCI